MNPPVAKPSSNLWPHAIMAWFVIFAAALAAWVTFAMRQPMDLVSADYYEEEIRFQHQLDRLERTAALGRGVQLSYASSRQEITLRLPGRPDPGITGQIRFYRPSQARLDFQVPLAVDGDGVQRIGTRTLRGGLWKVRVQWQIGGQDYFFEQTLVADEPEPPSAAGGTRTK